MQVKLTAYNMEWMKDLFYKDGTPKTVDSGSTEDKKNGERSKDLATVVKTIKPDILCIIEGPDTLKNESKTASQQLQSWCELHGLANDYAPIHGLISGGQQELCALYKKKKLH